MWVYVGFDYWDDDALDESGCIYIPTDAELRGDTICDVQGDA